MAQFYVTYSENGERHMAIVVAPQRPTSLRFADAAELTAVMNALGHEWQLLSVVQLPYEVPTEWLEEMAEAGALKDLPKSHGSLFGGGHSGNPGFASA